MLFQWTRPRLKVLSAMCCDFAVVWSLSAIASVLAGNFTSLTLNVLAAIFASYLALKAESFLEA